MKYTISILLVIYTGFVAANETIDECKNVISKVTPYKIKQWASEPIITKNNQHDSISTWGEVYITYSDGNQYPSSIRCVYQTAEKKVVFLSIFDANIISPHENQIAQLEEASKEEAKAIAISLGITENVFAWLKKNGKRNFYGVYNPEGKILGFPIISAKDLKLLNDLYIINLYPEQIKTNYSSSATKISAILSEKL